MMRKRPGLVGNPMEVYILDKGFIEVKKISWSISFLMLLMKFLANLLKSSELGLEELMQFFNLTGYHYPPGSIMES